jgi:hypothetical protein
MTRSQHPTSRSALRMECCVEKGTVTQNVRFFQPDSGKNICFDGFSLTGDLKRRFFETTPFLRQMERMVFSRFHRI